MPLQFPTIKPVFPADHLAPATVEILGCSRTFERHSEFSRHLSDFHKPGTSAMTHFVVQKRPHASIGAVVALTALLASAAAFGQSGPFDSLAGSWAGGGQISFADGHTERVRCRSDSKVGEAGNAIEQSLRCASDSYNFTLHSAAQARGGQISGTWSEETRNVSGNLSGRVEGNRIAVRAVAGNFTVALTLTTTGNSQAVTIQPQGETQITGAAVKLTRRGANAMATPGDLR